MKRVIATLAAASLFAVVPVAPAAPAYAAGDTSSSSNPAVDQCKSELGVYPGETLGDCIALRTTAPMYFSGTGGNGFLAHICSFFMTSEPDVFYASYDSYNECILDAASNLP